MRTVILGATGPIGTALSSEIKKIRSIDILQLAARSYVNKTDGKIIYKKTNLLDAHETEEAVKGMTLAYLTVGLPYNHAVWERDWPIIIKNVINACEKYNVKLVFFDNVYAYGLVNGTMTEETPFRPISKKGQVRKLVDEMILQAIAQKKLTAVIAKSADYYGPNAKASPFYIQNIENLLQGKKPLWIGDPKMHHSFTYIPDAVQALIILGMETRANNQIWHIPTAKPLTGNKYMELITKSMDKPLTYGTINKLMLRFVGLINPAAGELVEMFYQNDHDYLFDSSKFEHAFTVTPTPYAIGIKKMTESFIK